MVKERCYGNWGNSLEKIVYKSKNFIIVKYPAFTKTNFCYEVVPVVPNTVSRLNDIEICPEPDNFNDALKMMNKYKRR